MERIESMTAVSDTLEVVAWQALHWNANSNSRISLII